MNGNYSPIHDAVSFVSHNTDYVFLINIRQQYFSAFLITDKYFRMSKHDANTSAQHIFHRITLDFDPCLFVSFKTDLDRCYKRKYTSKSFSIKHLLEKQDRKVFRKVSGIDRHPLRGLLPKKKASTYNLRNRTSQYPKVNTDRFKNSYINRLIFKYNLAM